MLHVLVSSGKSYSSPAGALECVAPAGDRLGPRPRKEALPSFVLFCFFWFGFGSFKWFPVVFV
jgi:hypothetical protein